MRKITLLLLTILCCSQSLPAQTTSTIDIERRIYLWDVTLSMRGYNNGWNKVESLDIYDSVLQYIINDINNISDPNTEIYVCPFQDKNGVLAVYKGNASQTGKDAIFAQMKTHDFCDWGDANDVSYTDIIGAFRYAKDNLMDKNNRSNLLLIYTDGSQNINGNTQNLIDEIKKWGEFANKHNAYAIYYMLKEDPNTPKIKETIDKTHRIDGVPPGTRLKEHFTLEPSQIVTANIKEDKSVRIKFSQNSSKQILDQVKFSISLIDDPLGLIGLNDVQLTMDENNMIELPLNFNFPYEELRTKFGEELILHLKVEKISEDCESFVSLRKNEICLKLINKKYPRVKIGIKSKNKK